MCLQLQKIACTNFMLYACDVDDEIHAQNLCYKSDHCAFLSELSEDGMV